MAGRVSGNIFQFHPIKGQGLVYLGLSWGLPLVAMMV